MITRDAAHRYTYEGVQYPGVTSILGVLDKSGPLMGWAARETATAAVTLAQGADIGLDEAGEFLRTPDGQECYRPSALQQMLASIGEAGTIKALSSRSNWQRDEAAQLGTEVHALADLIVHGKPLPAIPETQRKRVEHYARWWEASGWRVRLSEAMVVHPDVEPNDGMAHRAFVGWGGTFDLLAYDRDGKTVLADVKTGKGVYKEAVLQLAAYGMASLVQPCVQDAFTNQPARVYPMPLPDRYVILHVTAEGVREIEVAVGTAERMAFLACLDLYHWTESMKGKRL